jgi:hypothetical protein
LKTVVLRTPVNEWLDPKKEAPSFEGAFLVSAAPPSRNHTRAGYFNGMGIGSRSGKIYRVTVWHCGGLFLFDD